ncbi:uncharacterized protein LOC129590350 [Paramacrobiotus metropolitanus]|uniref:uncharacterized protein LOC129590350 n=1 Tax=Paramacrobiotus metropolitanus TaxID=2943436 RepID=UPI0024463EE6|nr:uncharacterized protein LOC129590350 [Paramacrobiotus metropolitanus]
MGSETVGEPRGNIFASPTWTWSISPDQPSHRMTAKLYRLPHPASVYQAVVRQRFPAAFLDARMLTGSILDLQIACCKALARHSRQSMLTKSLPMEMLYALSPRTGISDALKLLGFKADCEWVVVLWIIPANEQVPSPSMQAFESLLAQEKGQEFAFSDLTRLSDFNKIAQVYDFPMDLPEAYAHSPTWKRFLLSHVTSKIAIKE